MTKAIIVAACTALIGTIALGGCRRPLPSEEGARAQEMAGADAVSASSGRAYQASPAKVAPAAKGTPVLLPSRH